MPTELARATRNVLHALAAHYGEEQGANDEEGEAGRAALRVTCLRAVAYFNRAIGDTEDA